MLRTGLTLIALTLALTHSAAAQSLTRFEAEYRVKMKGLRGEMRMSLQDSEAGLVANSQLQPRGLASLLVNGQVRESAWISIEEDRVVPRRYSMHDTIARDEERAEMQFDWDAGEAHGEDAEGEFTHPINHTSYDRTSIQYALMLDLLHGRSAAEYTMLDGSDFKELTIRHLGDSVVRVPLGEFNVRKVEHQADNSSRVTTLYCARELGYLPVKIEQHKDGKLIVRAELRAYQPAT